MSALCALILVAAHVATASGPDSSRSASAEAPLPARDGFLWPRRVIDCAATLGVSRCIKAFAAARSERAAVRGTVEFDLRGELERFPWERYADAAEEELDARVLDGAAALLGRHDLTLAYPGGLLLEVTRRNGSLHVNVSTDDTTDVSTGRRRGSKWRRTFYRIIPFLLIPPLILAAILPFKLPAFMMMTMGAVILNNMAFTGSLFTLLRNNAFDDNYEKKVIYINEGYKNEESFPSEGTFSDGIKASFPEATFQTQGDTFFPGDLKVKKRRGHKRKRKPIQEDAQETAWNRPEDLIPLEELPSGEGVGEQFGGLYQGISGEEQSINQLPDYSNFRSSVKPNVRT